MPEDVVATMADDAIIFAMANPNPEVHPEVAHRHARVVATGRSDFPNQINNVLAFPGIFRGAFDVHASAITEGMKLAAAQALADLVGDDVSEDLVIPVAVRPAGRPGRRRRGRRGRPARRGRPVDLEQLDSVARMFAVTAQSFSSDDPLSGLVLGERPEPEARDGWTTITVKAASLNHHDLWSLRGVGLKQDALPMILGCDAAGLRRGRQRGGRARGHQQPGLGGRRDPRSATVAAVGALPGHVRGAGRGAAAQRRAEARRRCPSRRPPACRPPG